MTDYPSWICSDCGQRYGRILEGHLATWHEPDPQSPHDRCGWCGSSADWLTEPRDFGHPAAPVQIHHPTKE